jgi:hypothetical protein
MARQNNNCVFWEASLCVYVCVCVWVSTVIHPPLWLQLKFDFWNVPEDFNDEDSSKLRMHNASIREQMAPLDADASKQ